MSWWRRDRRKPAICHLLTSRCQPRRQQPWTGARHTDNRSSKRGFHHHVISAFWPCRAATRLHRRILDRRRRASHRAAAAAVHQHHPGGARYRLSRHDDAENRCQRCHTWHLADRSAHPGAIRGGNESAPDDAAVPEMAAWSPCPAWRNFQARRAGHHRQWQGIGLAA